MVKKLTLKQKKFAHKYLQNGGNATQAALESYDTEDYNTASQLGHKNLRSPVVRSLIQNNFKKEQITTNYVLANLMSDIEFTNEPNPYRTRALEMVAKYLNMFDEKPIEPSYMKEQRRSQQIMVVEEVSKFLEEQDKKESADNSIKAPISAE